MYIYKYSGTSLNSDPSTVAIHDIKANSSGVDLTYVEDFSSM